MPDTAPQTISLATPAPAAAPSGTRPKLLNVSGQPFQILVVDDIEANRDVLRRRLERTGYKVAVAASGSEALKSIEATAFDLVLLDVMMPGMSGIEVLQRVRKTRTPGELPIIMATAKDQSADMVQAFQAGASDYVTKPLDFAVVLARVETQLLLKRSVQQVLELQNSLTERNAQLERINAELVETATRMRKDLDAAAKIQESFLPEASPKIPGLDFAWTFEPCDQLAGDMLNIVPLGDGLVGVYVLDVSGHGVPAALLAVAAARALSPAPDPDSLLIRPAATGGSEPAPPVEVADRLNQKFSWETNGGQFLTLFYALVDLHKQTLTYVSAGHPGAIVIRSTGESIVLDNSGLPIGFGEGYIEHQILLHPGDRFYLYSDGVTETMDAERNLFGMDRLQHSLCDSRSAPLKASVDALAGQLSDYRRGEPVRDDVSIVAVAFSPATAA